MPIILVGDETATSLAHVVLEVAYDFSQPAWTNLASKPLLLHTFTFTKISEIILHFNIFANESHLKYLPSYRKSYLHLILYNLCLYMQYFREECIISLCI